MAPSKFWLCYGNFDFIIVIFAFATQIEKCPSLASSCPPIYYREPTFTFVLNNLQIFYQKFFF